MCMCKCVCVSVSVWCVSVNLCVVRGVNVLSYP